VQPCVSIPDPQLGHTEKLLEQILIPILQRDARVRFLCPPGEGEAIAQRIRVMLSRKRKGLERQNKKPRRFRLHSSIHKETHDGVRKDCLIMWQSTSDLHLMTQDLEDVLTGNGKIAAHG
jgi:hypothetical protein